MTDPRPAPYPADTRAKGWRFELEYERIEQSDTWAIAEEVQMAQHALLFMWLAAWRQVPCGSLPADETMIRAKCRIPPKLWAGLRDVLMRGWWLADDGRLYHDTIAERVQQMLDSRGVDRTRQDARQKMLEKVRERDGRACVYCAHTKYLTLDHLLPISRGGDNDERNLAMACRPCNSKKGARTPDEAGMTLENKTAMARWLDYMADRADPQKTKVIGVSPLEKSGEVERDDTGTGTGTIEEPKSLLPQAPAFPAENRPAEPPQLSLVEATKPRPKTVPDCPHQAVLALWAEVLPAMPQHNAGMWGGTRADHLRARWRETAVAEKWETETDGLAYMRRLFGYVGRSAFLTGRSKGGGDRPPFVAELAWIVNPQNWAKVHEGKYHTDAA